MLFSYFDTKKSIKIFFRSPKPPKDVAARTEMEAERSQKLEEFAASTAGRASVFPCSTTEQPKASRPSPQDWLVQSSDLDPGCPGARGWLSSKAGFSPTSTSLIRTVNALWQWRVTSHARKELWTHQKVITRNTHNIHPSLLALAAAQTGGGLLGTPNSAAALFLYCGFLGCPAAAPSSRPLTTHSTS